MTRAIGARWAYARWHPGQAGGSDALAMLALFLLGCATTVVFGCTGAIWSWRLTLNGIDQASTVTKALRWAVAVALCVPLLLQLSALRH